MSRLRSLATAIAVLFVATPLIAQSNTTLPDTTVLSAPAPSSSVVPSAAIIDRGPPADPTSVWMNAKVVAPLRIAQPATVRVSDSSSNPRNTALMLIGGAGLLVGSLVGGNAGTVIMVGGGAVGLYGLWNYLK
jgi:hypothetical protein